MTPPVKRLSELTILHPTPKRFETAGARIPSRAAGIPSPRISSMSLSRREKKRHLSLFLAMPRTRLIRNGKLRTSSTRLPRRRCCQSTSPARMWTGHLPGSRNTGLIFSPSTVWTVRMKSLTAWSIYGISISAWLPLTCPAPPPTMSQASAAGWASAIPTRIFWGLST